MVLPASFCFLVPPPLHTIFLGYMHVVLCFSASQHAFTPLCLATPRFPPPPISTKNKNLWSTCSYTFPFKSGGWIHGATHTGEALWRRETNTLLTRVWPGGFSVRVPQPTSTGSTLISCFCRPRQPWLYPTCQFGIPLCVKRCIIVGSLWISLISHESGISPQASLARWVSLFCKLFLFAPILLT